VLVYIVAEEHLARSDLAERGDRELVLAWDEGRDGTAWVRVLLELTEALRCEVNEREVVCDVL
jgi:hypothetical protein